MRVKKQGETDVGKKGGRKREGDRKENGKVEERDDGGKRKKIRLWNVHF